MRLERKTWYWVAALVLGGWLLYRLLAPAVVVVDVATVSMAPLVVTVGDQGMTRVRDRHLVAAPVAGRMERIGLQPGDSVAPATILVRLLPLPLDERGRQQAQAGLEAARDHYRTAQAAAAQARVAWQQARSDRDRAERLVRGGGIAAAEVERLQLAEQAARREVEAAEFHAQAAGHEVEAARAALTATSPDGGAQRALVLRSPVRGRVLAVPERSERVVAAGETLLELGDPASLEVVVDLLSTDAVRVSAGDRLRVTNWGGDSTLAGRVRHVEPSGFTKVSALGVEEQRVNVIGDLDSVPARLGDRYRVDVQVVLWQADSVLQVPSSALFREGDGWALFAVEGGRARLRTVTVGHESAAAAEVLSGVAAGDVVIRHPTDRIADGVRVRPRGAD